MATKMLPGCMSAWKKASRNTCVKKISTPARASRLKSMPASRSRPPAPIGMPDIRSITITSLPPSSPSGPSGTSSSGECSKLRRSCEQFAASRVRSSSSCSVFSNSATTSRGRSRLPSRHSFSSSVAAVCISEMSFSITWAMFGRSTLTATGVPSGSSAKWTCATDALATGVWSNDRNTSSIGLAVDADERRLDLRRTGNGGTRSCSFASSSAMSGGRRSRRVDSIWPNLTKIGPSSSSASRRRTARGATGRARTARAPIGRNARNRAWPRARSSRPCRNATTTIRKSRPSRMARLYRCKVETLFAPG